MALLNFDASQIDPSVPFEALPPDKYLVEIAKSEMKPTKAGDGKYLELEYIVLEGEYKGRKIWDRLCLDHPTPRTVEIAKANLSAICHAIGVMKPGNSSELHHIPMFITVKMKKDMERDLIYNEIKGYAKWESSIKPDPQPQQTQYQQAPVNDATPPWERTLQNS